MPTVTPSVPDPGERVYIYDRSGNLVNDPERATDYATDLTYSSMWPKGHANASFKVKRAIAKAWAVKNAYSMKIRNGQKLVWQGILQNINKAMRGVDEVVTINASGYISVLAQRTIRKRWTDNAALTRFYWPAGRIDSADQYALNSTIRGDLCYVKMPGSAYGASGGDQFQWQYDGVVDDVIIKVTFDYNIEAGADDTLQLIIYNVDQTDSEAPIYSATDSGTSSGAGSVTFTDGDTDSFRLIFHISATDGDCDGIMRVTDVVVFTELSYTAGVANYYADEIIRDVLNICTTEISTDTDQLTSPSFALIPFTTKSDKYESADTVCQRAVSYGDGSGNSWGFSIWDDESPGGASSDGKPKPELKQRPGTNDYEYNVLLGELTSFQDEESLDELYNWVSVEYTDQDGDTSHIWPGPEATLTDATSVTNYGRRDKSLSVGKSSSSKALEYGERFLALHKDPLRKSRLSLTGQIRTKQGLWIPAAWVRAGERVRVADYDGGVVFLLRNVQFNSKTKILTLTPDLPPDDLAIMQAQSTLEAQNEVS